MPNVASCERRKYANHEPLPLVAQGGIAILKRIRGSLASPHLHIEDPEAGRGSLEDLFKVYARKPWWDGRALVSVNSASLFHLLSKSYRQ